MNCEEAKILSIAHILGDLDPDSEQYRQLESHLASCRICAEEYKSSEWTIKFIEQHKAIFAEVLKTPEEEKAAEQEEIERSWERIEARLEKIEVQEKEEEKHTKFRSLLVRVSAVAACLIIGVFIWMMFSIYSKPEIAPKLAPQQITLASKVSVEIEFVSKYGNILIPANQQIVAGDELKTLIINGKHRLVMNSNTILTVEPLVRNMNIGCLIKLASGRIYTYVEHDGNPFIVDTAHGKAVITGTTFDVKVIDDSTTLVVSEGTVQFESEDGAVRVATGQTSQIVGQSAPSRPTLCNATELTAWATGYEFKPSFASSKSSGQTFELPFPEQGPLKLSETNYKFWIEGKRDWFKREFPWIFVLRNALVREGIKADYPELLIQSGDVWQFRYQENTQGKIAAINAQSFENVIVSYGYDKLWLQNNMAGVFPSHTNQILQNSAGISSFESWLNAVSTKSELDARTLSNSWHAVVYLIETRSLIWFAVKNGVYDLTDQEQAEILDLLQKEVDAACISENLIRKLYRTDTPKQLCCHDEYQQLIDKLAENIEAISSLEKEIAEYEIGK